jgi:hypothetical protein
MCCAAGKDIENGGGDGDVPKPDNKPAGAAPVKTEQGEQEVDFKTLTAEEAFQVLGVSHPLPRRLRINTV